MRSASKQYLSRWKGKEYLPRCTTSQKSVEIVQQLLQNDPRLTTSGTSHGAGVMSAVSFRGQDVDTEFGALRSQSGFEEMYLSSESIPKSGPESICPREFADAKAR